jgi:hypothetical protein
VSHARVSQFRPKSTQANDTAPRAASTRGALPASSRFRPEAPAAYRMASTFPVLLSTHTIHHLPDVAWTSTL